MIDRSEFMSPFAKKGDQLKNGFAKRFGGGTFASADLVDMFKPDASQMMKDAVGTDTKMNNDMISSAIPFNTPVLAVCAVVTIGRIRATKASVPVTGIVPPTPSKRAREKRSSELRGAVSSTPVSALLTFLLKNLPRVNTSSSSSPNPLPIARVAASGKAKSVLDLFLGSGSTMVAAHQLKRKCYGME